MHKRSDGNGGQGGLVESGPSLRAVGFVSSATGTATRLLTKRQQQQLAALATQIRIPARTVIYRAGSEAAWVFIGHAGVIKAFHETRSGVRRVVAFLFADDLFGLAENGRYVNTTQAITESTLYRIPTPVLTEVLRQDAELQFQFLCKVTHELRQTQRRSVVVGHRGAASRLAMFFGMLADRVPHTVGPFTIPLPMSRSDIAGYLNLSLEAVSRASRRLVDQGVIAFENRHVVKVLDKIRLGRLAMSS